MFELGVLLEAHRRSLAREYINPESSPLVQELDEMSEKDRSLACEEYILADDLCMEEGRDPCNGGFEWAEPFIVDEMTRKYGRC